MFVFRCCAVHCGDTCGRLKAITLQIINVNDTATYNCFEKKKDELGLEKPTSLSLE